MKDNSKTTTKLVSLEETAIGEAILTLQRGDETKQTVIAETGLSQAVYEYTIDYYLDDLKWSQARFDHYWENGGEDKEIASYIDFMVDQYDDDLTWKELL